MRPALHHKTSSVRPRCGAEACVCRPPRRRQHEQGGREVVQARGGIFSQYFHFTKFFWLNLFNSSFLVCAKERDRSTTYTKAQRKGEKPASKTTSPQPFTILLLKKGWPGGQPWPLVIVQYTNLPFKHLGQINEGRAVYVLVGQNDGNLSTTDDNQRGGHHTVVLVQGLPYVCKKERHVTR